MKWEKPRPRVTSMPILHRTCSCGAWVLALPIRTKGHRCTVHIWTWVPSPKEIRRHVRYFLMIFISKMDKTCNLRFCLFPLINISPLFQFTHHWDPKFCDSRRTSHPSPILLTLLPFFLMLSRQCTAAKMVREWHTERKAGLGGEAREKKAAEV